MKEIPPMKPIKENIYFSDLQGMNEKIPQEEANQPPSLSLIPAKLTSTAIFALKKEKLNFS